MSNFKKIIAILLVAGIAAGGYVYLRAPSAAERETAALAIVAATGNIEDVVTAQGKLEPKEYVDVGVQVSGQLKKMHVDVGDTVAAGDLLAEIDPEIYEAQVRGDEARVKTLEAQLVQQDAEVQLARQQFKRNELLVKSDAISKDAFDTSKTALRVAEAQRVSLKAQLEEAQSTLEAKRTNLGYARIYAPIAGTVVSQALREGQTLNATQTSPVLLRLANLDVMTVRAQAAEADVPRIKPGTDVYFTTLGSQERRWSGAVRQILPSPEVVNNVVLYNVLIDVDNRDRQLMDGMSTQVFFVLGRAENVVTLPVSALGKRLPDQDGDGTLAYAVRLANGQEKTVQVGLMSRTTAEIRAGIAAGDAVQPMTAPAPAQQVPGRMRGMGPRL